MKKIIAVLMVCFIGEACDSRRSNLISESLRDSLKRSDKHDEYVKLLDCALTNQEECTLAFFKIDYIYDAPSYDHGSVVLKLMRTQGDSLFSHRLKLLDSSDLSHVKSYIEVGIDPYSEDDRRNLIKKYFRSFAVIGLEK